MGKKKGKDKKGKGAEKTAQKTDRKADKKLKKELQEKGEDDIEKLIAEFQEQDKKRLEVTEVKCAPPSPRCNMSLTSHPDKDELIMYGGEYFNGKLTYVYNDMFVYNIRTQEWTNVKSPNMPPPRCGHQTVAVPHDGGQLWVFGGEFASPSQSQFYHYKDLWMFSLRSKLWSKVNVPGGPSSRSGHRMVACKKMLFIFGGFHDNIRDYKYYNDLHAFSLETYTWVKLDMSGNPPAPRSACVMGVSDDQNRIIVYGGYSKERLKKEVDKGKTHTDMTVLAVSSKAKQESAPIKWKWQPLKQSGYRPSPRCGCSLVVTPGNRALVFGGVFDKDEDEEDMTGEFYNDLYSLELDKGKWFSVSLRGSKDHKLRKKRRKKKEVADTEDASAQAADAAEDEEEEEEEEEGGEEEMEEEMSDLQMADGTEVGDDDDVMDVVEGSGEQVDPKEPEQAEAEQGTDGAAMQQDIFSVTVGDQSTAAQSANISDSAPGGDSQEAPPRVVPAPRMNALLAVKHGILYLYGGMYEADDKQYTLADMYSLDLHKLETWNTLIESNLDQQVWQESDDSSGDEEDDEDEDAEGATGQDMDMEEEEESSSSEEEEDEDNVLPPVEDGETLDDYFSRNQIYWITKATAVAEEEGLQVSAKQIKKAAYRMAKDNYTELGS